MTSEEMWKIYSEKNGLENEKYEAWAYGDDPDKLAELTANGIKTATCSAYYWYETEGEKMPKAGGVQRYIELKGRSRLHN